MMSSRSQVGHFTWLQPQRNLEFIDAILHARQLPIGELIRRIAAVEIRQLLVASSGIDSVTAKDANFRLGVDTRNTPGLQQSVEHIILVRRQLQDVTTTGHVRTVGHLRALALAKETAGHVEQRSYPDGRQTPDRFVLARA